MWAWSQNDKEVDDPTLRYPVSVCLWYLVIGLEVGEQLAKNVLVKEGYCKWSDRVQLYTVEVIFRVCTWENRSVEMHYKAMFDRAYDRTESVYVHIGAR